MFLLYWPLALLHGDVNKCRRDSHRHPKRGNNNKKGNRTWQCSSRDRARRLLVEPRRFEENFAAALIAAIFHRQEQQCRPTSVKRLTYPAPFFADAKGDTRSRAVNVTRCTRVPGVSKGDLLLMAYWNGMSTVIKRDGPTAPWRSPLNVRRYIRARKGASRGGRNRRIVFFLFAARLHCTRGPRAGSIKIISDALMRNYEELSSFFIFAGTSYSVRYHSFMNVRCFKLQKVIEIYFLALFVAHSRMWTI